MKKIPASTLADMLRDGFCGQVQFDGVVYGRVADLHPEEANGGFYEARGRFTLHPPECGRKGYFLQQGDHHFRFEHRKDIPIRYSYSQGYGDIIVVPITLH